MIRRRIGSGISFLAAYEVFSKIQKNGKEDAERKIYHEQEKRKVL
jgi:hypothetical protein